VNLTAENEALHLRVCELEDALGYHSPMPRCLGLSPIEAAMLGHLEKVRIATKESLFIAGARFRRKERSDDPQWKVVEVQLGTIRRKVAPHGIAITNIYGEGWYLPPESKAKLADLRATEP
jgi:hypothetical protein